MRTEATRLMLTYLQRLRDERDRLSAMSSGILDTAAREEREATETERASVIRMGERCTAIDTELRSLTEQYESQRAYATLRERLGQIDETPNGNGNGHGRELERRRPQQPAEPMSWGEAFTSSDAFQNYSGHGSSGRVDLGPAFEARTPITTDTPPDGALTPMRWTGNATQSWAPRLLVLANTVTTTAGAVDWIRWQPHPPSEAAIVPEGELKPEANLTLELMSGTLDTIAHFKAITRQALEDIPNVQNEVTNRLRAGIQVKMQNLLMDAINAETDFPAVADAGTMLGGIRTAIGEMDDSNGYQPSAALLNPADWADIDLAILAGTLNGPQVNSGAFGIRFVGSNKVPAGTAYVGDFNSALTVFQRSATSTYLSDSHSDYFLRNQLVILAETRALAVVTEPLAMVKVTVATVPPAGNGA